MVPPPELNQGWDLGTHVGRRAADAHRLSPQRAPRPAGLAAKLAAFPRIGARAWNAAARALTGAPLLEILWPMGREDTLGADQCGEPGAVAANGDRLGRAELSSSDVDTDDVTGYSLEREAELRTLCDPRVREAPADTGFSSSVITIFPSCWPMPPHPAEINCPQFAPLHPMSFLESVPALRPVRAAEST